MENKLVSIGKSSWGEGEYEVATTRNGFQWTVVYKGSLIKAKVIFNAFKRIGYERGNE